MPYNGTYNSRNHPVRACKFSDSGTPGTGQRPLGNHWPCVQAQRAGVPANDSATLFPGVWAWKHPAFTNMCSEVLASLDPADRAAVDLSTYAGYFEAGSAPPSALHPRRDCSIGHPTSSPDKSQLLLSKRA